MLFSELIPAHMGAVVITMGTGCLVWVYTQWRTKDREVQETRHLLDLQKKANMQLQLEIMLLIDSEEKPASPLS